MKRQLSQITSEEFLAAYQKKQNRDIIHNVLKRYAQQIPHDELESCGVDGLLTALRWQEEGKGMSFTSALHMGTSQACQHYLRQQKKHHSGRVRFEDAKEKILSPEASEDVLLFEDCLSRISREGRQILEMRRAGFRIYEIGERLGMNRGTVSRKLNSAIEEVRRLAA